MLSITEHKTKPYVAIAAGPLVYKQLFSVTTISIGTVNSITQQNIKNKE
jgi:hypothetical protein